MVFHQIVRNALFIFLLARVNFLSMVPCAGSANAAPSSATMRSFFPTFTHHVVSLLFLCATLLGSANNGNASTYGEKVVAAVIMGEARGEGIEGMIAIGEVIWERAKIKREVPRKIVVEPLQFSCLNGTTADALITRYETHKEWAQAMKVAQVVYNYPWRLPGITKGATHYNGTVPWWAKGKAPTVVIGNHIFWRMPKEVY